MKRIIASDYDGTLRQNGVISPRSCRAVEEFRRAGHLFGLITGRDYVSFHKILARGEIPFEMDFAVLSGGSVVCDGKGNVLFSRSAKGDMPWGDTTLARAFMERCFEWTGEACGIAMETSRLAFHPELPQGGPYPGHETVYDPHSAVDGVKEFVLANAHIFSEEDAVLVVEKIRAEFGSVLSPVRNGSFMDISPIGGDKAAGLSAYARYAGIPEENVWAVGDNHNDVSMLRAFHGCAIKGKPAAEAGVAEFLCDEVADVVEMLLGK